ncbi:hypothetical protein FEM08_14260 [Flavobacterium gilvum]|nr:hypothetical protein FEM08_14260 [Flavobacterium gilvum]
MLVGVGSTQTIVVKTIHGKITEVIKPAKRNQRFAVKNVSFRKSK